MRDDVGSEPGPGPGLDDDDVDPGLVLALDPATPPETLRSLADNPGLHLFLALHPRADEELLNRLAAQGDPEVVAAVEQRAARAAAAAAAAAAADEVQAGDVTGAGALSASSIAAQPAPRAGLARFWRSGRGRWAALGVVALVTVAAIVLTGLRPPPATFVDGAEIAWQKSVEDIVGVPGRFDESTVGLVGDQLIASVAQLEGRDGRASQVLVGLDAVTGVLQWEREGNLRCATDSWLIVRRDTAPLACAEAGVSGDATLELLRLDPATGRVLSETPLPGHRERDGDDEAASTPIFVHVNVVERGSAIVVTSTDERNRSSVATVLSQDGAILNGPIRLSENEWVQGVANDGSLLLVVQEYDDSGEATFDAQLLDPDGETVLELFAQYDAYTSPGLSAVLLADGTVVHSPGFEVTGSDEREPGEPEDSGRRVVVAREPGWLWVDPSTGQVTLAEEDGMRVVDPTTGEVTPNLPLGSAIEVDGETGYVRIEASAVVVVDERGEELFRHVVGGSWNLVAGGAVLGMESTGAETQVRALDPVSGELIWELEGAGWTTALSERAVVLTDGSDLTVIRPSAAAAADPM